MRHLLCFITKFHMNYFESSQLKIENILPNALGNLENTKKEYTCIVENLENTEKYKIKKKNRSLFPIHGVNFAHISACCLLFCFHIYILTNRILKAWSFFS